MPIKTMTTNINVDDYINRCSSIEELNRIIDKCNKKIQAVKEDKMKEILRKMADLAGELASIFPYDDSPFYNDQDRPLEWDEVKDKLIDFID